MRKIIVAALMALLLIPAAGAQDTLAVKINKKNLVIKEWNTEPRSGARVLDHVTTYSPEGKKIEEIE